MHNDEYGPALIVCGKENVLRLHCIIFIFIYHRASRLEPCRTDSMFERTSDLCTQLCDINFQSRFSLATETICDYRHFEAEGDIME